MGIQGLLPLLKSIQKPCNLKKFAGQTIGVDAYGWLHRGTVACAIDLAMGKPTRKFVDFAMHRVRMLQHFGVVPFLVFDGDYLPSKAATETDRAKRREESKRLGLELLNAGKASQAYLELQKAVDVTPEMARQLIDELRKTGVQYIVAPYEADAQMVYLERKGIISGILSEDSDLLVFGAKCLLTKLDQYGDCIEINKADFCACREINLTGWSDTEFRRMAILSGCDYLNSINNMGLKTAYRMIRKHKTIEKVLRMIQFDGKYHVPKGYLQSFYRAELTFLYQRVYCPVSNSLVFHTEPTEPLDEQNMLYIGAFVDPEVARRVAIGDLNPMTKQLMISESSRTRFTQSNLLMASRQQHRHAVAQEDLKKGVSIEQFFKPSRIPLGELDPNCFTPSPTQQNALLRNRGPWAAESAPRPYLRQSAANIEPELPRSAPNALTGRNLPWTASPSETRPQKRSRLCSDDVILGPLDGSHKAGLERSPFFGSSAADPSPSIGRFSKAKRPKKDDFTIFSDDSIEEALLSLPDFGREDDTRPERGEMVSTLDERDVTQNSQLLQSRELGVSVDDFQISDAGVSQASVPTLTQGSSLLSSADELPTPIESTAPLVFSNLKDKFAFTPKAALSSQQPFHDLATPPSSVKNSRIPRPIKPASSVTSSKKPTQPPILTPLQSLGVKAMKRSTAVSSTPPFTPASNTALIRKTFRHRPPPNSKSVCRVPFPEVSQPEVTSAPIRLEPADVPLPVPDEAEANSLSLNAINSATEVGVGKGSEDLIVHDSDEELEEESTAVAAEHAKKLLLDKFTFRG